MRHLLLVTKHRDHAYFALTNGMSGSGRLEGLGFYIDDTTNFRDNKTNDSSHGMLGPFAYVKIRILDATTLAQIGERNFTQSSILVRPSTVPSAMALWESMSNAEKLDKLKLELIASVNGAMAMMGRQ